LAIESRERRTIIFWSNFNTHSLVLSRKKEKEREKEQHKEGVNNNKNNKNKREAAEPEKLNWDNRPQ
jgi:hypothetical protein